MLHKIALWTFIGFFGVFVAGFYIVAFMACYKSWMDSLEDE